VRGLVAEVVGFVDDNEVVVAPVHVGEINVAGSAAVAGEVGVVENVVIEAVGGEEVAAVISLVECPVVAQALRHEHKHTVIAQLVVFDDGERLERLAEADAVGNDAAAQPFQFVDGPDNAVALKLYSFFQTVVLRMPVADLTMRSSSSSSPRSLKIWKRVR
jgi:hypothetical protein